MKPLFLITILSLYSLQAVAWGKRGHSIVATTAAYLVAEDPKAEFMKSHSFDLGYYSNVPDLVWKKPETYETEWYNHFMDLEIFDRQMKDSKIEKPFTMDRLAFNKAFPDIELKAGRSWWRIRELQDKIAGVAELLKKEGLSKEEQHKLQGEWLLLAGTMGHYVGDMSQPLHCTENYDGQLTNQKGIHAFFEDEVVDQLYPGLETEVLQGAQKQWAKFSKANAGKETLTLMQELTKDSLSKMDELLKIDKQVGRTDMKKAKAAYKKMIQNQLIAGSLRLAELWRRNLGWKYDGKKFYIFHGTPEFVAPPKDTTATPK